MTFDKLDFEDIALEDLGQSVVLTPMVKTTSNFSGSPTYTAGTNVTITAIFRRRSQSFDWEKSGFMEQGDAMMQVKEDQVVNKDDLVTVGTDVFRVLEVITRQIAGTEMFKSCNLAFTDK